MRRITVNNGFFAGVTRALFYLAIDIASVGAKIAGLDELFKPRKNIVGAI